jgi:hypothetical protein
LRSEEFVMAEEGYGGSLERSEIALSLRNFPLASR